jgi:putative hemolysin
MGTEIIVIILLIILNGVLAMSEIALVSARKTKLDLDASRGDSTARLALSHANSPSRILSAIQIGITLPH